MAEVLPVLEAVGEGNNFGEHLFLLFLQGDIPTGVTGSGWLGAGLKEGLGMGLGLGPGASVEEVWDMERAETEGVVQMMVVSCG